MIETNEELSEINESLLRNLVMSLAILVHSNNLDTNIIKKKDREGNSFILRIKTSVGNYMCFLKKEDLKFFKNIETVEMTFQEIADKYFEKDGAKSYECLEALFNEVI